MRVTLPLCAVTLIGAVALSSCDQKTNTTEQTTEPATEVAAAPAPDYSAEIKEHNDAPMVFDAEQFTIQNPNYRTSLWTGKQSQMTLMSIPVGDDVGLECHDDVEQFFIVYAGKGTVKMGDAKDNLSMVKEVGPGDGIIIPLSTWHNVINASDSEPLKLLSIYAPVEHPAGTVQPTHADAMDEEH